METTKTVETKLQPQQFNQTNSSLLPEFTNATSVNLEQENLNKATVSKVEVESPVSTNDPNADAKLLERSVKSLALKTFLLFILKRLAFPLLSLKLASAMTIDLFIVSLFRYYLKADEATIVILEVCLKLAFGLFFLVSIKDELLVIANFLEKEFTINKQVSLILLLMFFVILAFAVLFFNVGGKAH